MGNESMYTIGYIVLMIALFYFLLIRPQQKMQKKRSDMIDNLRVDDKVVTVGGIIGIITEIMDDSVWLEVSEDVEIEVKKAGIAGLAKDNGSAARPQADEPDDTVYTDDTAEDDADINDDNVD